MSDTFIELNDANFMETIEKEEHVLVDFYASWCGSCRIAAPMFLRVAKENNILIYKLEVEGNPKTKEMLSLPGLPSIAYFKNGEPADLINTSKEEGFKEFLKKNNLIKE